MIEFIKNFFVESFLKTIVVIVSTLGGGAIVFYIKNPILRAWKAFRARGWLKRIPAAGVSNFFPNRDSYQKDRDLSFSEYLASAEKSLSYCGHWLAFSIDQHNTLDSLCGLVNSGKKVQLILLNPDLPDDVLSTYAKYFNEEKSYLKNQISNTWKKVLDAKENIGANLKQNFELRKHEEFISYSSFWFDKSHAEQHILIDAKIFGISRRDSYGIELKPSAGLGSISLFERYSRSIEALINKSKFA